jgi:hypothetical protein
LTKRGAGKQERNEQQNRPLRPTVNRIGGWNYHFHKQAMNNPVRFGEQKTQTDAGRVTKCDESDPSVFEPNA